MAGAIEPHAEDAHHHEEVAHRGHDLLDHAHERSPAVVPAREGEDFEEDLVSLLKDSIFLIMSWKLYPG